MSYKDALEEVNGLLRFGIKPGLERIGELLKRLGNPQDKLQFVHVAGTNGKGSVCTMLSCILRQAGYKTGLFTSPYVVDFRERMQINGKMISREDLTRCVEDVMKHVREMAQNGDIVTEFEVITAVAMAWFAEQECEAVVLEVGLGGRFDATNIISAPLASVICSLSLDHTAILGDTIEQIAFEKCGIIKKGGVTVCYPNQSEDALKVIMRRAAEENNILYMGNLACVQVDHEDISGTSFCYGGMNVFVPLPGRHQIANAVTAIEAAKALRERGLAVRDSHILAGIASASIPARMELLCRDPLIILDGGHNSDATNVLAENIKAYLHGEKIVAVMGMMEDKDYRAAAENLAPLFASVLTVTPTNPRALSAEKMAEEARKYCNDVCACESFKKALGAALDKISDGGVIIICGSLYLAGDMREMTLQKIRKKLEAKAK